MRTLKAGFVVVALAVMAVPADGLQITKIQWDVTSGTFLSPVLANGPVTSGTLTWTPGAVYLATSVSHTYSSNPTTGTFFLTAKGPDGRFVMTATGQSLSVFLTSGVYKNYPLYLAYYGNAASGTKPNGALVPTYSALANPMFLSGTTGSANFIHVTGLSYGYAAHTFVLGNEVRTVVVPEPSTGALVALGLVGLVGTAARSRRRGRA